MFSAYIQICASVKAIKYDHKYIYKRTKLGPSFKPLPQTPLQRSANLVAEAPVLFFFDAEVSGALAGLQAAVQLFPASVGIKYYV